MTAVHSPSTIAGPGAVELVVGSVDAPPDDVVDVDSPLDVPLASPTDEP